jgi:hypothetical protein
VDGGEGEREGAREIVCVCVCVCVHACGTALTGGRSGCTFGLVPIRVLSLSTSSDARVEPGQLGGACMVHGRLTEVGEAGSPRSPLMTPLQQPFLT